METRKTLFDIAFFARERELCETIIRNRKDDELKFSYDISNKYASVFVHYKNRKDWNVENGKHDLNRLWKNFNLAFIGYKPQCLVLNYKKDNIYTTEYMFPMLHFNIENVHSLDFQKYEANY